jgi:hypothetical protein
MTRPVPNTNSPLVDKNGKIINPWNIWFQQFSQQAPAVVNIVVGVSPFSYRANNIGQIIVRGGTVSNISLIRGNPIILSNVINFTGALSVPVSIGDIVKITYSVLPTVQFLET